MFCAHALRKTLCLLKPAVGAQHGYHILKSHTARPYANYNMVWDCIAGRGVAGLERTFNCVQPVTLFASGCAPHEVPASPFPH